MHNIARRPRNKRCFRLEPMHQREFVKRLSMRANYFEGLRRGRLHQA